MLIQRTSEGYRLGNLEAVGLPPRQSQTLLALASGLTQKAAAEALGCKPPSVRNACNTLLFKLQANNSVHMVTSAFTRGNLRIVQCIAVMFIALHTSVAPYTTGTDQEPLRPRSRPAVRIRRREENHTTYMLGGTA